MPEAEVLPLRSTQSAHLHKELLKECSNSTETPSTQSAVCVAGLYPTPLPLPPALGLLKPKVQGLRARRATCFPKALLLY